MADWRQIQARIRKARVSADPAGILTELYEQTHDAMVAYELARAFEKTERPEEAVRWYTTSWERFRRLQWKEKAAEALTRLGAPVPAASPESASESAAQVPGAMSGEGAHEEAAVADISASAESEGGEPSGIVGEPAAGVSPGAGSPPQAGQRRRGRRGGRGRRRGKGPEGVAAASETPVAPRRESAPTAPPARFSRREEAPVPREIEPEPASVGSAWLLAKGRAGDPGLASRMAQLESQLRRLIGSPLHNMDDVEIAPAGPGVFLISESDQTAYYYIEACRTLRIALAQLTRSGRSGSGSVRSLLAEHLGVTESRVAKYLKDHCVVRWIQLDEDSARLAHFAIAVLRPSLNE